MGRLWLSFPQFVTNHLKNLYLRFKWVLTWIPDMLRLKIGNALFLYNTTTNHFHNIKYPSCYRYASLVDELLKVLWQHKHAHCTLRTIERSRNCLFVCLFDSLLYHSSSYMKNGWVEVRRSEQPLISTHAPLQMSEGSSWNCDSRLV